MSDRHTIANGYLSATVCSNGAELCSLQDATGQEMLWQAGPEWPRHAPVLFPIVGELRDQTLRVDGQDYRMGRHGFARDRRFAWGARTASSCRLVLHDDPQTRAIFPYGFRFSLDYALADDALEVTYTVVNTGSVVLPCSAGAHPAFRWPLADGADKSDHVIEFEIEEPEPIRRLDSSGLLLPNPVATPVIGNRLALDPDLFDADAIVMERPRSQSLRYAAPGAPTIEVSWEGFRDLGIWSKPGADFLCIEPWYGTASPADFHGEFRDKPGLMLIPPGDRRVLTYRIRFC
ncbi:MAG: aldose 1-epimerase family protein [Proteobacteria bacterium]|nr:aldose 1-epimerase family protein [Pseudomonadota bacterium]